MSEIDTWTHVIKFWQVFKVQFVIHIYNVYVLLLIFYCTFFMYRLQIPNSFLFVMFVRFSSQVNVMQMRKFGFDNI